MDDFYVILPSGVRRNANANVDYVTRLAEPIQGDYKVAVKAVNFTTDFNNITPKNNSFQIFQLSNQRFPSVMRTCAVAVGRHTKPEELLKRLNNSVTPKDRGLVGKIRFEYHKPTNRFSLDIKDSWRLTFPHTGLPHLLGFERLSSTVSACTWLKDRHSLETSPSSCTFFWTG